MSPIVPKGPFLEYSVVYTDRVFNLMSPPFQECMRNVSANLKSVYKAKGVAFIPGSGSYAMEAVARQFARNKRVLTVRNGFFSYRYSDIFQVCHLPEEEKCIKAEGMVNAQGVLEFSPPKLDALIASIKEFRPAAVFAPHVETATGIILPDEYLRAVGAAAHEVGALFCVDGIASGTEWVDMEACNIDVLVSAPQKCWSSPASIGIVLMSDRGLEVCRNSQSDSFCCNLLQWLSVMEAYENKDQKGPGFKYYTTLPTDAIMTFASNVQETINFGIPESKEKLRELGRKTRAMLQSKGCHSIAAPGFQSPGVVVVHNPAGANGAALVGSFKQEGIQVAGGVPFMIDEKEKNNFDAAASTFRIGLFGLNKLENIDQVVARLEQAVDSIKSKL